MDYLQKGIMPRVLIIDKTAGLLASRERHVAMAQWADMDLHVFGPRFWVENGRWIEWCPQETNYQVHLGQVLFKDYYARHFYYSGLCRALRRSQPEIIQLLEEPWAICSLQALLVASVVVPTAKVLFYTWENIYRAWKYPSRLSPLYAMIDRLMHDRSQAAVCATHGAREVLLCKGYSKPVQVIPYGLPSVFFQPDALARKKPDRFTVGYVGRMLEMKGVDILLEAASCIPTCHVKLIGEGEDKESFQALARELGIEGRVEWCSSLAEEKIPGAMRKMDVVVLPSRTTPGWKEQLGRVVIEAMALGVPVIGSDSGALPEVIGDAGLLFREGDAMKLRDCILSLYENPERREELGEKGKARAREHFTWDGFAREIHALYQSLMR